MTPRSAETAARLGLVGMEERARLTGGDFAVRANPRGGMSVIVSVPILETDPLE